VKVNKKYENRLKQVETKVQDCLLAKTLQKVAKKSQSAKLNSTACMWDSSQSLCVWKVGCYKYINLNLIIVIVVVVCDYFIAQRCYFFLFLFFSFFSYFQSHD